LDSATRTARLFSFTDCTTPAGSNRFVPDSHDAVSTTMYAQPGRALTSSIVPITPSVASTWKPSTSNPVRPMESAKFHID